MTEKDRIFLKRINDFAEEKLSDIDPQKTLVSVQLEALKPILEEIAKEENMDITDVFIKYMDIQSEASLLTDQKLKESLKDVNEADGSMPLLYR